MSDIVLSIQDIIVIIVNKETKSPALKILHFSWMYKVNLYVLMVFKNIFVIHYDKLHKFFCLEGRKIQKKISLRWAFFLEKI